MRLLPKPDEADELLTAANATPKGRPCTTCQWPKVALIDQVFERIVADPQRWERVRMMTILTQLQAHGYPLTDIKSIRKHLRNCRPELFARVQEAAPYIK